METTQESPDPPDPERKPRRRGRTTLIVAAAAALGILGGTCTGYVIQAGRAPTALPALSQAVLKQAKGPAAQPLAAAQDRQIKTDGDLRKLLVKRPRGAKEMDDFGGHDGWVNLLVASEAFNKPAGAFNSFLEQDFRRRAEVAWGQGRTFVVEMTLTQFRDESAVTSEKYAEDADYWAGKNDGSGGEPIPGSPTGLLYLYDSPHREAGYMPVYTATAVARRGDIVMEMWFSDVKPVGKKKAMDLAEQQWERL